MEITQKGFFLTLVREEHKSSAKKLSNSTDFSLNDKSQISRSSTGHDFRRLICLHPPFLHLTFSNLLSPPPNFHNLQDAHSLPYVGAHGQWPGVRNQNRCSLMGRMDHSCSNVLVTMQWPSSAFCWILV